MATPLPLSLLILKTVESYKRIPKSLLYSRIAASDADINEHIQKLEQEGALKVDGDEVSISPRS
jgi:biotin operon repressor